MVRLSLGQSHTLPREMPFVPGEIISHSEMCAEEGTMLQRGMTFRPPPLHGIILMSQRPNAPYVDGIDSQGNITYEGHDAPRSAGIVPKNVDQPRTTERGTPTENGKFANWTDRVRRGEAPPARFRVYEKLRDGIWAYKGAYLLRDYAVVSVAGRNVFRFELHPIAEIEDNSLVAEASEEEMPSRLIPTWVKQQVYKRDKGRCVICSSATELHFDHDFPYSKGGTSATPDNVRLLCARHNLSKGARIE